MDEGDGMYLPLASAVPRRMVTQYTWYKTYCDTSGIWISFPMPIHVLDRHVMHFEGLNPQPGASAKL